MTLPHTSRFKRTGSRIVASIGLITMLAANCMALATAAAVGSMALDPTGTETFQERTAWVAGDPGGGIRLSPAVISTPVNLVAIDEFNSRDVLLTWAAGAGTPLESLIERQRFDGGNWAAFGRLRLLGPAATMTDNPGPGRYRYRVATVGTTGRSEYSDWASLTVVNLPAGVVRGRYPRNPDKPLGMNLEGVTYYSRGLPFNNVMRMSKTWVTQLMNPPPGGPDPYDTGDFAQMPKDENNYPLQVPFVVPGKPDQLRLDSLIFRNLDEAMPTGRFALLHDGDGEITIGLDGQVAASAPGRIEFDIRPGTSGVSIGLRRSTLGNHVRNIRICYPGRTARDGAFTPEFINAVKPYSVLRFMDWQETNNSTQREWADRPVSTRLFSSPSIEEIIELCNIVHADPWICVPHMATDDYVTQLARTIRDQLEPERKVYIERSNEVWNGIFQQSTWSRQQGEALGLPGSGFDKQLRFHAKDSARIFRLFEREFGGTTRLRRVLGSFIAMTYASEIMLTWLRDEEPDTRADMVAIAPYFGNSRGDPANVAATLALGMDGLLSALNADVDGALASVTAQRQLAEQFGVDIVAYEAGQHLVGYQGSENNDSLTDLFVGANRSPLIYPVLRRYHELWWTQGGKLQCAFSHTGGSGKWGSWGYIESIGQPISTAPKLRALLDAAAGTP